MRPIGDRSAWRGFRDLFLPLVMIVCPGVAGAIGTVTDGGVTFGYPTDFVSGPNDTVNANLTGAAAGDQLFETWWFFRVAGDGQETAFGIPDAEIYTLNGGAAGRLDWNDPGGAGLFSASLGFDVIESAPGQGTVFQNMYVTNERLTDLTIDVFHYIDLDLGGSYWNDRASLVANPDGIEMSIYDGSTTAPLIGYGADAYQVTTYASLRQALTDTSVTDLDDSGLPFGGGGGADFTGAFQWSVTIGAGETSSFLTQFGSDAPLLDPSMSAVPEPGPALLMALGLAGLAASGRRARD